MKRLSAISLILGLTLGCAFQPSFTIPVPKTRSDFLLDREVCRNLSGCKSGSFDSGPLLILFPFAWGMDWIRGSEEDFYRCMIERGYQVEDRGKLKGLQPEKKRNLPQASREGSEAVARKGNRQ